MNWTSILFHPVTMYGVLLAMLLFGALLYLTLRLDLKALRGHLAKGQRTAAGELEELRRVVAGLGQDLNAGAAAAAPTPGTVRSGLNLTTRSQALRMHRRGSSAEQIAAALGLPRQEIELLLKVQQILLANV
jgi:hypothetical protein